MQRLILALCVLISAAFASSAPIPLFEEVAGVCAARPASDQLTLIVGACPSEPFIANRLDRNHMYLLGCHEISNSGQNPDYSRFFHINFNNSGLMKTLSTTLKGRFSHIIFDCSVTKFVGHGTSQDKELGLINLLAHLRTMLTPQGQLYIPQDSIHRMENFKRDAQGEYVGDSYGSRIPFDADDIRMYYENAYKKTQQRYMSCLEKAGFVPTIIMFEQTDQEFQRTAHQNSTYLSQHEEFQDCNTLKKVFCGIMPQP